MKGRIPSAGPGWRTGERAAWPVAGGAGGRSDAFELELHARTPTQHGERFFSRFLCFPEPVVAF